MALNFGAIYRYNSRGSNAKGEYKCKPVAEGEEKQKMEMKETMIQEVKMAIVTVEEDLRKVKEPV